MAPPSPRKELQCPARTFCGSACSCRSQRKQVCGTSGRCRCLHRLSKEAEALRANKSRLEKIVADKRAFLAKLPAHLRALCEVSGPRHACVRECARECARRSGRSLQLPRAAWRFARTDCRCPRAVQASRPLQKAFVPHASDALEQQERALLLPAPLYVLYMQAVAHKDSFGESARSIPLNGASRPRALA